MKRAKRDKKGGWRVGTYDTFEEQFYGGGIKYSNEETAQAAARKELARIKKFQPDSMSGGQEFGGIQDRVFIVRPDGTKYRFLG